MGILIGVGIAAAVFLIVIWRLRVGSVGRRRRSRPAAAPPPSPGEAPPAGSSPGGSYPSAPSALPPTQPPGPGHAYPPPPGYAFPPPTRAPQVQPPDAPQEQAGYDRDAHDPISSWPERAVDADGLGGDGNGNGGEGEDPPWGITGIKAPRPDSRYANATVAHRETGQPWAAGQPLPAGEAFLLQVDIGPLSARSQVTEPVPFPDELLPPGDLVIDVVVSSAHFTVGRDPALFPHARTAEDQFFLPGNGSPARADGGGTTLTFVLGTPAAAGPARLRIVYYYRGAVVQSQLLEAEIGVSGHWRLVTDYTAAAELASAAVITARPRVAVVLNGDETGHEIYVRHRDAAPGAAGGAGQQAASVMELPAAIGDRVRRFRQVLASEPIAPQTSARSRRQLHESLRALAPLGWELCAAVFPGIREALYQLADDGRAVLHVARPAGVSLSVPWALLYTISIDSSYGPGYQSVPLCPLVSEWDGKRPLVSGDLTECPRAGDVPHHRNLLCPFGFLGLRHDIEQLSRAERPVLTISAVTGSSVVVAETSYQVNQQALRQHVSDLRQQISARLPGVQVAEAASKAELEPLIGRDLPLLYFYCHGERPSPGSQDTFLGIGNHEWLSPPDFMGWIQDAYFSRRQRVWDTVRPLVFINACHSAELDPAALFNYVDAFVGAGNAAGVIGTEVKVAGNLAMEFAQSFFGELFVPGTTVAAAIRRGRLAFLAQGNIFGLNYTPYCWADLTVLPA
jgi:CHAT domain